MLPDTLQNALAQTRASTIVGAESGKRAALRNEQQATEQMVHAVHACTRYVQVHVHSMHSIRGTQALLSHGQARGASLEAQPNNGPDGLLLHRAH